MCSDKECNVALGILWKNLGQHLFSNQPAAACGYFLLAFDFFVYSLEVPVLMYTVLSAEESSNTQKRSWSNPNIKTCLWEKLKSSFGQQTKSCAPLSSKQMKSTNIDVDLHELCSVLKIRIQLKSNEQW